MNWHEFDRSETTVYASHELVYRGPQILILFNVLAGRNSQLNQDNLETNDV